MPSKKATPSGTTPPDLGKKKKKTIESPKKWDATTKCELVKSIDTKLKTAYRHHKTTYTDIMTQLCKYKSPGISEKQKEFSKKHDRKFAPHLKAFLEYLDAEEPCTTAMLDWWLMEDETKKELFIAWSMAEANDENIHFYISFKVLKDDEVLVRNGDLLPRVYLVKFMTLTEQLIVDTIERPFNMEVRMHQSVMKDYAEAKEAVGKNRKEVEKHLREAEALKIMGSIVSETLKKKKKSSKKKIGDGV